MTLDEFLQKMREEGGDAGAIMADKITLLDKLIGTAMRGASIQRTDGLAPFAAVTSQTDPGEIRTIYLPIDTVVRQIIGPALESAVQFMAEGKFKDDPTVYHSVVTKEVLDVPSYAEGMIDCLVGMSMSIMETMTEAKGIIRATLEMEAQAAKEEIKPTGDKNLDAMVRASTLINSVPKKTIH